MQLKINDKISHTSDIDPNQYLYNPFLFSYATLLHPDSLEEIPYSDNRYHYLSGSVSSCVYHLKDPEDSNKYGAFFVFSDIAVIREGKFRLKISLFKICRYHYKLIEGMTNLLTMMGK